MAETGMKNGQLQHHLRELALNFFLKRTNERNRYELSEHGKALLLLVCAIAKWEPSAESEGFLSPDVFEIKRLARTLS